MEMKISELLDKYGSDKVNGHTYGEPYDILFGRFDREAKMNILEIGIQKGGSLRAWKEYFPNSQVVGVDILDEVKEKHPEITYIKSDIKDWRTDDQFDIIIDDGSHYLGDIVYVVSQFLGKLNLNGVMVVEDIRHATLWVNVIMNLIQDMRIQSPDFLAVFKIELMDLRRSDEDDNFMVCITRTE